MCTERPSEGRARLLLSAAVDSPEMVAERPSAAPTAEHCGPPVVFQTSARLH